MLRQLLAVLPVLIPAIVRADTPAFTAPPTVARDGDAWVVRFAARGASDASIWIETADGRPVRHLACVRPGEAEQSIRWDGRDDRGQPVKQTAGLRVRVGLDLAGRLEKTIGHNPADLGGIRAMAAGPDGRLYLVHTYGSTHSHDSGASIVVLGRDGRYLKTIVPYPAGLDDKQLAGLQPIRLDGGARVPRMFQFETRSYVPGLGDLPNQHMIVTRDGRLAFAGIAEGPRPFAQPGEARLTVIRTDGSVPENPRRTLIHPLTDTAASLALSPDEKVIYAAGVRAGTHPAGPGEDFVCDICDHGGRTWRHTLPVPFVFRFTWDSAQAELLGKGSPSGGDDKLPFIEPVSVATDAAGLVYVADAGADRIFVVRDQRPAEVVARIAVDNPWAVRVSRKTGAIYVIAGDKELQLIKLDGHAEGRQVAALKLDDVGRWGVWPIRRPILCLDESGDEPVLWTNNPLARIADRGKLLEITVDLRDERVIGRGNISSIMELSLDPARGILYLGNGGKLNVASGEWGKFQVDGGRKWPRTYPGSAAGCVGLDGNYYSAIGSKGAYVHRYDGTSLKEIPFTDSTDTKRGGRVAGYSRDWARGLAADAKGNVYVLFKRGGKTDDPAAFHKSQVVSKFAPDGRPVAPTLIDSQMTLDSVRVDHAGNVYVVAGLRPGERTVPPGLAGKVAEGPRDPLAVNGVNNYPLIYGSVIKFGPEGGAIGQGVGGVKCNFGPGRPIEVKGARWIAPGVSVTPAWAAPKRDPGTIISCVCEAPGIAVDPFGRTFYPDAARARVGVLAPDGGELAPIGSYGNPDSAGGGADIPLAWPQAVATDGQTLFVADRVNRRLLQVKLDYAATAETGIK